MLFKFLNREENVIALDMFEATRKSVGLVCGVPTRFIGDDTMVTPENYVNNPSRAIPVAYNDIKDNESLYEFLFYRYEVSKPLMSKRYAEHTEEELQTAKVENRNAHEALSQFMVESADGYYGHYNDLFVEAIEYIFNRDETAQYNLVFVNFVKTLLQAQILADAYVPHHRNVTAVDLMMFISIPAYGTQFGGFFPGIEVYKDYKLKDVIYLLPPAMIELFVYCTKITRGHIRARSIFSAPQSPYFNDLFNETIATYFNWDKDHTEFASAKDYYMDFCNRNNPDMADEYMDEEEEQDHNPFIDDDEDKRYED